MTTLPRFSFSQLQDRLARAVGIDLSQRGTTISAMLRRDVGDAASYWLQVFLSMGIATLGLVLGSTGVVIGAMLISPLMSPIVELAMGLCVSSPFLVLRASWRVIFSIALVILSSSALTTLLPFHELNAEINSRTSPNVLDLIIATFCALSAAFTTVRSGSSTASTAAGTAIGISLVPPLCVVGYGVGAGLPNVAKGALLLFTANFSAIILFGSLAFLLLGYSKCPVIALEEEALATIPPTSIVRRISDTLRSVFRPPWGPLLRVLMPVVMVAAVFVPLRGALLEVSWQVRVRAEVAKMLDNLPQTTVRTAFSVERSQVLVRLLIVGKAEDAARTQTDLTDRIRALPGTTPRVDVVSVPDEAMLQAVAALATHRADPTPAPPEPPARGFGRDLRETLGRRWPGERAGTVQKVVVTPGSTEWQVGVVHVGEPLGSAGEKLLGQAIAEDLGVTIRVEDQAIPTQLTLKDPADASAWFGEALSTLQRAAAVPSINVCVALPPAESGEGAQARRELLTMALTPWGDRALVHDGAEYSLRFTLEPCEPKKVEPDDAGTPDPPPTDGGKGDSGKGETGKGDAGAKPSGKAAKN